MKRNFKYYLGIICISLSMISATVPSAETKLEQGNSTSTSASAINLDKIIFQEVASGLNKPVVVTNAGDGSDRLFIVEQSSGKIKILKNGALLPTPFLDLPSFNLPVPTTRKDFRASGNEQGLLGLAFHPQYATNGEFFVVYTAVRSGDSSGSVLVLEKFHVSAGDADQADTTPASHAILLTIDHPSHSNHNGGNLAFGQDGYLYWSTGDGGGAGDPGNNAQNLSKLLGKILRIDVNGAAPYEVPSSNPFYSNPNANIKKEIWAYGLRNPWRFSFDRLTHDLYIGDVGQSTQEEIDFQPAASAGGQNYGWRVVEGGICFDPAKGCNKTGKTPPVAIYSHTTGCSVTGGYVYRGINFPSLYGRYFYGDYCTGRLFMLFRNSTPGWDAVQSLPTPYNISAFGEDEQGELYLVDYGSGKIYNIGYQEPGPRLLTPEDGQFINEPNPEFTWQDLAGAADHYEIVIASDPQLTSIVDSKDDVVGASFTPVTPLPDGQYYWRVRGISPVDVPGAWSDTASFTIDTIPLDAPLLSAPQDTQPVPNRRPTFRWLADKLAINYQIEIDDSAAFSGPNKLTVLTKRKTQYLPQTLQSGTLYYWHVRVLDKAGNWSSWSATFTFTTP